MALSLSKRVRNIARFRDIMSVLAAHGFDEIVDQLDLEERIIIRAMIKPRPDGTAKKSRWERIVEAMQELGPTFVKFGQILSTRSDLLPADAIVELKKLQAHVKAEPFDAIRAEVETAIGGDIEDVFSTLSEEPLAAASMAQVHRATLKDGGREVVLKVLRPGIRQVVENDLDILRLLAGLAERIPELRAVQPKGVVREFERAMLRELDLTLELANIRRFRENFQGSEIVSVPEPFEALSSRSVLVMEFLRGVPFNEYAKVGADREKIAKRAIAAVFKMVFDDGFFHADPHPGNVLAMEGMRIGILDMGQAGRMDRMLRDRVIALLSALVRDDPDRIAEAVFALGEVTGTVDFPGFRKDVMDVYEDELRGKAMKSLNLGAIFGRLTKVGTLHHMAIPPDLTMMFKSLVTMEGVAKEIYPELDALKEAEPFVRRLLLERYSPERLSGDVADLIQSSHVLMQTLPRRLDRILSDLEQGRIVIRVEEADPRRRAQASERIAARTAIGIGAGGLAIAGALMVVAGRPYLGGIAIAATLPLILWTLLAALRPRRL